MFTTLLSAHYVRIRLNVLCIGRGNYKDKANLEAVNDVVALATEFLYNVLEVKGADADNADGVGINSFFQRLLDPSQQASNQDEEQKDDK